MPATGSSSKYVVRSKPSWKARLALCVLAFLASGVVVYRMASKTAGDARVYSATATIFERLAPPDGAGIHGPNGLARPDPFAIEREILSEENLRHALGQLSSQRRDVVVDGASAEVQATVDQVARNLRITTTEASEPERGLRITISGDDEDPNRAVRLVNTLAEAYANKHGANLQAAFGQDYLDAQKAAERARQEYLDAKGRFDDFVERHFHEQQTLAEQWAKSWHSTPPVASPPLREVRPPAVLRRIENPEWVELQRQLAELEHHRAQLLIARTPLHPEVRNVEVRIVRVKQRLDTVPDHLLEEKPEVPPPEETPAREAVVENPPGTLGEALPGTMVEACARAVRAFRDHKEALERAHQNYDRLAQAERQAWERQTRGASVELEPADRPQVSQPSHGSARGLLGALAAALVVACGVGLISSGFEIDPPLNTPGQVEKTLLAPIVGQLPATGTLSAGADEGQFRPASGLSRIISGAVLIAVCFGILVIVY